jgi:hypothetical protein
MHLIAGIDEIGSETQLSEGWTYALFSEAGIKAIDAAVAKCAVKTFHGKKFKKCEADDYGLFLKAIRQEVEKSVESILLFTLQDLTWKSKFVPFAKRLIAGSMKNIGATDQSSITIAEHLFPGLICLQRLTKGRPSCSIEVKIDSDSISKQLTKSANLFSGHSVATSNLLSAAYEAYRKRLFPTSPKIVDGGISVLTDANSRIVQVADVFGNFALSYLFFHLGHPSKTRAIKAKVFDEVFGELLDPKQVSSAASLVGDNDIQLKKAGGYTLSIELEQNG